MVSQFPECPAKSKAYLQDLQQLQQLFLEFIFQTEQVCPLRRSSDFIETFFFVKKWDGTVLRGYLKSMIWAVVEG